MDEPTQRPAYAPQRLPLHCANGVDVAVYRCCAGPRDRPYDEQHAAFVISYVEAGVFSYRTTGGTAVLGAGWLMLGNDGEPFVCSHEHNDGRGDSCIALSLSGDALESVQSTLARRTGRVVRFARPALPPAPRVSARFIELAAAGDEAFARDEACLAALAAVLSESEAVSGSCSAGDDARAHAAARFLERHAASPLSLDAVAAEVGLSAFHFIRIFRGAIGVTPHQYLMRIRLLRAVALLRDTTLPVTDVAYEVGWGDLSTFNRTFRREIGCTPRELRRGRQPTPRSHS